MGVGDIDLGQTLIEWPWVGDGRAAMHKYDEGSFAPNEIYEELEEGINGERLAILSASGTILFKRSWLTSYTSRKGEIQNEAFSETRLAQDPAAKKGTRTRMRMTYR